MTLQLRRLYSSCICTFLISNLCYKRIWIPLNILNSWTPQNCYCSSINNNKPKCLISNNLRTCNCNIQVDYIDIKVVTTLRTPNSTCPKFVLIFHKHGCINVRMSNTSEQQCWKCNCFAYQQHFNLNCSQQHWADYTSATVSSIKAYCAHHLKTPGLVVNVPMKPDIVHSRVTVGSFCHMHSFVLWPILRCCQSLVLSVGRWLVNN